MVTSLATMDAFFQEAFTLLGVGLFVIGLRFYVRISSSGIKHLHADDYLMIVAAASTPKLTYLRFANSAHRWSIPLRRTLLTLSGHSGKGLRIMP